MKHEGIPQPKPRDRRQDLTDLGVSSSQLATDYAELAKEDQDPNLRVQYLIASALSINNMLLCEILQSIGVREEKS